MENGKDILLFVYGTIFLLEVVVLPAGLRWKQIFTGKTGEEKRGREVAK